MKNIFKIMTLLILISINSKVNAQQEKGYYYFAYASLDQYSEHIYITPVMFISKKDCDQLSYAGISNQFNDYIKAEYKGTLYKCEGRYYSVTLTDGKSNYKSSKATMVKSRRKIMEYAKKITKITDFEYLCE